MSERTPEEKLQLELDTVKSRVRQLEQQNEQLRCKMSWLASYGKVDFGDLPTLQKLINYGATLTIRRYDSLPIQYMAEVVGKDQGGHCSLATDSIEQAVKRLEEYVQSFYGVGFIQSLPDTP